IDVPQNPGGLLDQAGRMASMFLKNGQTIVQFEDKKGRTMKEVAFKELDDGFKVKEPVAVIIDGNSASGSEIFAAALHESANVP
ncbi:S41 family peptidase, partial [Enterococcus faecalis]|uniref:S41 family peptidase n=1 Tax=Enterococcus faecalis TaxID=1351 RepID=UPI003D6BC91C